MLWKYSSFLLDRTVMDSFKTKKKCVDALTNGIFYFCLFFFFCLNFNRQHVKRWLQICSLFFSDTLNLCTFHSPFYICVELCIVKIETVRFVRIRLPRERDHVLKMTRVYSSLRAILTKQICTCTSLHALFAWYVKKKK